jgi:hypothetical protein
MNKMEISSYDGVRKFSHFRSRSSFFVIGFQYVSLHAANKNEMSSSAWLARQLRHKSTKFTSFVDRLARIKRISNDHIKRSHLWSNNWVTFCKARSKSTRLLAPRIKFSMIFFSIVSATRGRGEIREKHSSGLNRSTIFPRPHGMLSMGSSLFHPTL